MSDENLVTSLFKDTLDFSTKRSSYEQPVYLLFSR